MGSISGVQAQSQDKYSLQLQGFVWNHTTLNALVVTADNESWWNTAYLNTALRAIGQWNDAFAAFASNYSDFSYLSSLRIQPTVSNTSQPGFDIYVNWTESPLSSSDEVGLSQIFPNYRNTIINCTVNLAAHAYHGDSLNEGDMQNIAVHELGHSLGLGHSNYTGDLMNAYYARRSSAETISTLDVYGVATVFAWELNATRFYPINGWLKENSVILPSYIPYQGLPVSPENARPQTLANNPVVQTLILMFEILIHPEIFVFVVLFIVILVVIAITARRKRG
ncbi:MAG: matrixin family metalloprotease [Chloroflexi bacterium]|nr:matrixin family metalloprotease [Chloroflexota bacterium]